MSKPACISAIMSRRRKLVALRCWRKARRALLWAGASSWGIILAVAMTHDLVRDYSSPQTVAETTDSGLRFTMPAVPGTLTDPASRADFAALHWWDCVSLDDAAAMATGADSTSIERALVDWLFMLQNSTGEGFGKAMDLFIEKTANNKDMYYHLTGLMDKYLSDPDSSMRNEELYDRILVRLEASPWLEEYERIIPRSTRQRLAMNRPGTLAADFAYETPAGKRSLLSAIRADYTLVYFYNPECDDCRAVCKKMEYSPVITAMSGEGSLKILAMYPDEDISIWKESRGEIPAGWIDARDPRGEVKHRLYDIRSIPALYLLDRDKTVMLKDASVDKIEDMLVQIHNRQARRIATI